MECKTFISDSQKGNREETKKWQTEVEQKTNNKVKYLNPDISIITLNINGLNIFFRQQMGRAN
jgi:hypothetical protein